MYQLMFIEQICKSYSQVSATGSWMECASEALCSGGFLIKVTDCIAPDLCAKRFTISVCWIQKQKCHFVPKSLL